jgi:hypothetical protein
MRAAKKKPTTKNLSKSDLKPPFPVQKHVFLSPFLSCLLTSGQAAVTEKYLLLLELLRFRSLLASNEISVTLDPKETTAIASVADILLGSDAEAKQTSLTNFVEEQGEIEGIPCTHLFCQCRSSLTFRRRSSRRDRSRVPEPPSSYAC